MDAAARGGKPSDATSVAGANGLRGFIRRTTHAQRMHQPNDSRRMANGALLYGNWINGIYQTTPFERERLGG